MAIETVEGGSASVASATSEVVQVTDAGMGAAVVPPPPLTTYPPAGMGVGDGSQFPATSLYVGDLDLGVSDAQLFEVFSQVGGVVSVRVCRDVHSRRSLGYAYVNFGNPEDAARALDVLNYTPINGKPIRIMYSNRDPSTRRSGAANIFIKNLDKSIDNKALYDTFSAFGKILSCKVALDSAGESRGYGFVQYEHEDAAQNAISQLNGMLLNDKKVFVGPFIRKQERENSPATKFSNVYVKNLNEFTTEENLKEIFGKFGTITSVVVMRDADGKSKCFGFVNFENTDDAAQAVQELNGKKFDDNEWYVGRAQKKSEREMELKEKFEKNMQEAAEKSQGSNLYLKNLDDSIGDDQLRDVFSEFGTITSCKVMRDINGMSRGSGFVAFNSAEDAAKALKEMNGKMVSGKPLYVAIAQRKEDRRARLQASKERQALIGDNLTPAVKAAQFSQPRPVAMPPSVAPRMPMYPPGVPGVGGQLFYGQPPPTYINPQAGFGFQQPLMPGIRGGAPPVPNFMVPMVQHGQQHQRPPGRHAGVGPLQHGQMSMPMAPQLPQMHPRGGGRGYRYPIGRGGTSETAQFNGGMISGPYDMAPVPPREVQTSQSIPISALASALANASPDQQRLMLGENLYPLVAHMEQENAAKITGMLLEMDQTEVLHLLESPEALKAKVLEAKEVLRSAAHQQQLMQAGSPVDQLAALSLNDGVVS